MTLSYLYGCCCYDTARHGQYLLSPYRVFVCKAFLTSCDTSPIPVGKEGPAPSVAHRGQGNPSTCQYVPLDGVVPLLTMTVLVIIDVKLSDLSPKVCLEHKKKQ